MKRDARSFKQKTYSGNLYVCSIIFQMLSNIKPTSSGVIKSHWVKVTQWFIVMSTE